MAEATLLAMSGARRVSREDLGLIGAPAASRTHFPIAHNEIVDVCEQTLQDAGYGIRSAEYALSQSGQQMFCTYTLTTTLANGACVLAVGLRSSYNKTLPLGLVAGTRVLVCSNLAFHADLINIRRLHTKNASLRFSQDIVGAIKLIPSFQESESKRIEMLKRTTLSEDQAEALILRSVIDRRIIPNRLLPKLVHEWREPTHDEFRSRSAWSLFNAFTTVLGERHDRNPNEHAHRSMRLYKLLLASEPSHTLVA